jgi:hypothetical protein
VWSNPRLPAITWKPEGATIELRQLLVVLYRHDEVWLELLAKINFSIVLLN